MCWLATVSRPDTCARPAQRALDVAASEGSGLYRIQDRIETEKEWRQAAVLKYQSGPRPGSLTEAGWSDAAFGARSKEARCRSDYLPKAHAPHLIGTLFLPPRKGVVGRPLLIGILPSSPQGPFPVLRSARGSGHCRSRHAGDLEGGVYASSGGKAARNFRGSSMFRARLFRRVWSVWRPARVCSLIFWAGRRSLKNY